MLKVLRWLLPAIAVAFFATSSFAQFGPAVTVCTESVGGATTGDSAGGLLQGGCVNTIPTSSPLLFVASDGEVTFDPFGAGHDTSDGIVLNSAWTPNNSNGAFNTGFWTQITGTAGVAAGNAFTWVLGAVIPGCGAENEPTCEPIATWNDFGGSWIPGTPSEVILSDGVGGTGDAIFLDNNGLNGTAEITFNSNAEVPEPASLILLGAGLSLAALRRRKVAAA